MYRVSEKALRSFESSLAEKTGLGRTDRVAHNVARKPQTPQTLAWWKKNFIGKIEAEQKLEKIERKRYRESRHRVLHTKKKKPKKTNRFICATTVGLKFGEISFTVQASAPRRSNLFYREGWIATLSFMPETQNTSLSLSRP